MKHMKVLCLSLVLVLIALVLTACQESTEAKYKSAQSLLAEGKYEEAASKFEELGSYEEASKLTMYCKAAAAGEKGDYDLAFSTFQLLGDYKESQLMLSYYNARQTESNAETNWENWLSAAKMYDDIVLFRDSQQRAGNCRQAIYDYAERLAKEKNYQKAIQVLNALGNYSDSVTLQAYYAAFRLEQTGAYTGASAAFSALGDYRDAKEQATQVLQRGYDAADALEKSGDQLGAYNVFIGLGEYKDSFERACKTSYDLGVSLRSEQKWDEAVTAFTLAGNYSDSDIQIKETKYLQAKSLTAEKKYAEALSTFDTIKGYKDADSLTREAQLGLFRIVGSYVFLGSYEQDNNTENGKDPIEWLVLDYDEKNNRALLVSRYGLDAKPYNSEYVEITWEKCTLREWLNGEFMSSAFSTKEQACILTTAVDNSCSQGLSKWDTDGGNNTQDKIFLLNYEEANKYLGVTVENTGNMKSRTSPTAYALRKGAWTSDGYKTSEGFAAGWWWLRSPGPYQDNAAIVFSDGSLSFDYVSNDSGCVHPALWINLESDIF